MTNNGPWSPREREGPWSPRDREHDDEPAPGGIAPTSDVWQPPSCPEGSGYVSPARLARVLRWMLGGWVVLAGLSAAASFRVWRVTDVRDDLALVRSMDDLHSLFFAVRLLALGATGIVFIVWTRRVYRNLEPLGAHGLRFKPGWAVGGWFVPFLNLGRPKQIVDDAWRGSDGAEAPPNWRAKDVPALLDLWWAAWIADVVLGRIAAGMTAGNDADLDSFANRAALDGVSGVVSICGALLAFWVVVRITDMQLARAGAMQPAAVDTLDPWTVPRHPDRSRGSLTHESVLMWLLPVAAIASIALGFVLFSDDRVRDAFDRSAAASTDGSSSQSVVDLVVGDCFMLPEAPDAELSDVEVVDCTLRHDAEIYAARQEPDVGPFPGDDAVQSAAFEYCDERFEPFVGRVLKDSSFDFTAIVPIEESWARGDRTTQCAVYRLDGNTTIGSAEGSGI